MNNRQMNVKGPNMARGGWIAYLKNIYELTRASG